MANNQETYTYDFFSAGLNTRDNVFSLSPGETPYAINQELVQKGGLFKKKGWALLGRILPAWVNIVEAYEFTDFYDRERIIVVSYPYLFSVNLKTFDYQIIYDGLHSNGAPFFWESSDNSLMFADGKNSPVRLDDTETVTVIAWPPNWGDANNDPRNMGQSVLGYQSNPAGTAIGFPDAGFFYKNRDWLTGDPMNPTTMFVNRINDKNDFSTNTPYEFDIAFFVSATTPSKIVVGKTISDKYVVIYCQRHLYLLSGDDPGGTKYPGQPFNIRPLNMFTGLASKYLVTDRGNNDHYFLSREGIMHQTLSTDNFQEVKPLALSEKIYKDFKSLGLSTLKRGKLFNNRPKGELWLLLPEFSHRRRLSQAYLLNYADQTQDFAWSRILRTNNADLRGGIINRETNELVLYTDRKFLQTDTGYSYDGYPITLIHQLPPLDFGSSENNKQIVWIRIYYQSFTTGHFQFKYLWDSGLSGMANIPFGFLEDSQYGTDDGAAVYGVSNYVSSAGDGLQYLEFLLKEPHGRILTTTIEQSSSTAGLDIHKIVFNFVPHGKVVG